MIKRMIRLARRLLLGILAGLAPALRAAIDVPRGVPQLFVDDVLIERSEGLRRTLRQPVKENGGREPILAVDKLEGKRATLEANGSILFDPRLGKHVMFALAFAPGLARDPERRWLNTQFLRFTSSDGLNWIPGDDGNIERVFPRTRDDLLDAATGSYGTHIDVWSAHYDTRDSEYPYKAWAYFPNWGEGKRLEGVYYMRSADGRQWERGRRVIPFGARSFEANGLRLIGPDDTTCFYHDPIENRFLVLMKFSNKNNRDPVTGSEFRSRACIFTDRLDEPVDLSRLQEVDLVPPGRRINGDEAADEYYGSRGFRYAGQWLGYLRIYHRTEDHVYSSAGSAYLKLLTSRDGLHWVKVPYANDDGIPEVFLPNGREGGNGGRNDGGYMTCFNNGPRRVGDELVIEYGASSYGKMQPDEVRVTGGGIFRARLRVDGFVSVDAGTLTTPALKLGGGVLRVNSRGPVKVALVGANERMLGTATLGGDSIRHEVRFDGKSIREVAGGGEVRLRFTAGSGAELYSFTVE